MTNICPVILCGGSGTRLWPLSRKHYPKQFINFRFGTLFEKTLSSLESLNHIKPVVVCNEEHRFFVSNLLQEKDKTAKILLEPEGRNTAPAIALAALSVKDVENDPFLLILPSDHLIEQKDIFHSAIMKGLPFVKEGKLITFGVTPTKIETGFGYLQRGEKIVEGIYNLFQFVEKPDEIKAQNFINSGKYLWNSGIFFFRASTYLNELKEVAPEMFEACSQAWDKHIQDPLGFFRPDRQAMLASPSGSIDCILMEKTRNGVMIELNTRWSDLGSWEAFYTNELPDKLGNVIHGDVISQATENCYLNSTQRLLCTIGIKNLIIIETADAILVVDRSHVQDIKKLLIQLEVQGRSEVETHLRVLRPWGSYEILASSLRYKVKKIIVLPGSSLSLQLHRYRTEHWVVVRGIAHVTINDEEHIVETDQSIYIPLATAHRLANYGTQPLEVIEVQAGAYLGEDDIIRLEDIYGRTEAVNS